MSATTQPSPMNVPAPPKPRRSKRLLRVLWATLALIVSVSLLWTWSYYSALAERDALIAELHAKGEPVWWDEVVDKLLAEPTENTGADSYLKAVWALGGDYNRTGPRLPSGSLSMLVNNIGDFQPGNVVPHEPAIVPEVQRQLTLAKPAFDFLAEAVKRKPGLVTRNIKRSEPNSFLLPHIQDSTALLRMNFWRVYDALARRDEATAYYAVWEGFAAAEQLSKEPWVVSQWVRFAMQRQACRQLVMCLEYAATPEESFKKLDALFASLDDSLDLEVCRIGDRAKSLQAWEDSETAKVVLQGWSRHPLAKSVVVKPLEDWWIAALASPLGKPVRLWTQVEELRLHQRTDPGIDRPDTDLKAADVAFQDYHRRSPIHQLASHQANRTKDSLGFAATAIAVHRCLIVHRLALRIRRYYDRHGRFPERLDDLCDATMPRIRLDWFQGRPLMYTPSTNGFRVGWRAVPGDDYDADEIVHVELKTLPAIKEALRLGNRPPSP